MKWSLFMGLILSSLPSLSTALDGCSSVCDGQPVAGSVSAYTPCAEYGAEETVVARLTNGSSEQVFYLSSCTEPPVVEQETSSGWVAVPAPWVCFCYCPAWNILLPGETLDVPVFETEAGTYRVSFSVGWDCNTDPATVTGEPEVDCKSSMVAVSEAYTVLP